MVFNLRQLGLGYKGKTSSSRRRHSFHLKRADFKRRVIGMSLRKS